MTFRSMTLAGITVLLDLRRNAPVGRTGADIMAAHHMPSGTVYPILKAMKNAGLVTIDLERGSAKKLGRPLRRFYFLTRVGHVAAKDMAQTLRGLL